MQSGHRDGEGVPGLVVYKHGILTVSHHQQRWTPSHSFWPLLCFWLLLWLDQVETVTDSQALTRDSLREWVPVFSFNQDEVVFQQGVWDYNRHDVRDDYRRRGNYERNLRDLFDDWKRQTRWGAKDYRSNRFNQPTGGFSRYGFPGKWTW